MLVEYSCVGRVELSRVVMVKVKLSRVVMVEYSCVCIVELIRVVLVESSCDGRV